MGKFFFVVVAVPLWDELDDIKNKWAVFPFCQDNRSPVELLDMAKERVLFLLCYKKEESPSCGGTCL